MLCAVSISILVLQSVVRIQLSQATRQTLSASCSELELNEENFQKQKKEITDAAAIAAYWAEPNWPVIEILICDDAPNYNKLTRWMILCWIHEGRQYKKLNPAVSFHRQLLDSFLKRFWDYYHELLIYKQSPNEAEHVRLDTAFNELFATQTGYEALDERIAKTRA
jgi:hypothetical protein